MARVSSHSVREVVECGSPMPLLQVQSAHIAPLIGSCCSIFEFGCSLRRLLRHAWIQPRILFSCIFIFSLESPDERGLLIRELPDSERPRERCWPRADPIVVHRANSMRSRAFRDHNLRNR